MTTELEKIKNMFNESKNDVVYFVTEWLIFRMVEQKPKTRIWHIYSKQGDYPLGIIKWFPNWRHYCYFPESDIVLSDRCTLTIANFIATQNEMHKKGYDKQ